MKSRRNKFTRKKGERRDYFAKRLQFLRQREPGPVATGISPAAESPAPLPAEPSETHPFIPLSPLISTLKRHIEKIKNDKRRESATRNGFCEPFEPPKALHDDVEHAFIPDTSTCALT